MKRLILATLITLCTVASVHAQANSKLVDPLLEQNLQSQSLVADELRHFMLKRVPPLVVPADAKQWNHEEVRIRAHMLSVLYHGWPLQWIDSAPKFEKVGVIEGHAYRIIKIRYEIVPGFESTALLYEPKHMSGEMPAILNVNGHGPGGKAVEHLQKRCINQARRGILALSLEWLDYGELNAPGNAHGYAGLLELSGHSGAGLFYLAMRRGLDYLYDDPAVDRSRIGLTGLSGGAWQTILLGSLDTRIGPAAAVAGFSTLTTSIEHPEYHDIEQNAADIRMGTDYAQLDAARAPRPTLLIYNAMDNCCFRAGIVKQGVYSDIKPFFRLYDKPNNLRWHLNLDPGTHNYGIDNREASYKFFDSAFHLDVSAKEYADTDSEVRSYSDLVVGLPKDNLTILGLAQSFAKEIHHEVPAQHGTQWAESQQTLLRKVVRYTPVTVGHAWPISATHEKGLESRAYRFEFSNGLSATGVLFRAISIPETAPTTILMSDLGMSSTMVDVANDVDRGQRVLVLDPLFFGENIPGTAPGVPQFAQLLNGIGERPLGLEAAQVTAVVRWLGKYLDHGTPTSGSLELNQNTPIQPVRIITIGPRSETVAMVAAAIEPELFTKLEARKAISSLIYAFDHPLTYDETPELMCLDLYRDFDFNTLAAIASPVKVDLSAIAPKRIFWE
ncbi:MAG: alpha/beta hydrolase family protein [Acidobacteriaceae bacterium]